MIPLIRPLMPSAEQLVPFLAKSRSAGQWSNFGPVHEHCVHEIRKWTGGHPVLCSSATTAIDILARMYMDYDNPRPILVPDYTHAGSILPFTRTGIDPVIVACDTRTRSMHLHSLEQVAKNIGIALIVNPFGRGIDRKNYSDIAHKNGFHIIYDYAGAWGDFEDLNDGFPTVYSFHATKSMPIGEGGCVVFHTGEEAEKFRKLTNFSTEPDRMISSFVGMNAKLSEISCAVLAAQLSDEQIPLIWQRIGNRRRLQAIYSEEIEENPMRATLHMNLSLCTVELPGTMSLREFESRCEMEGFVAKQYYIPLRDMEAFKYLPYMGGKNPNLSRCVALPSDVSIEGARDIAKKVRQIVMSEGIYG